MKMRTPSKIFFILVCHYFIKGSDSVCYGDLGCFESKKPFDNALNHLPQSPSEIGVRYKLFTRQNPNSPQILETNEDAVLKSSFNTSTRTKFIIHGYKHSTSSAWDIIMKHEILKREDVNVILVDWVKGARLMNYAQVAANTRVVGALLSRFMKTLNKVANGNYFKRIHLIGHSLGAHVAGYAGERIPGTGRITGFGMKSSIGHVDFYPNGGQKQPGCQAMISDLFCKAIIFKSKDIEKNIACSHMRALWLFIESINSNCWFLSFPSKDDSTCDTVCSVMGYDAPSGDPRGDRFLHTESYDPFCIP